MRSSLNTKTVSKATGLICQATVRSWLDAGIYRHCLASNCNYRAGIKSMY